MLEHHLHDRKREMISLAAEKRNLELMLLKQQRTSQEQPKFGDLFIGKESLDIPAKMRAIVEDNRCLKDKSRKLKLECGRLHDITSDLSAKNQILQSRLREAKQRIAQCSITAGEMDELQVANFSARTCSELQCACPIGSRLRLAGSAESIESTWTSGTATDQ